MIIDDHTMIPCIISVWKSTDSISSINFALLPLVGKWVAPPANLGSFRIFFKPQCFLRDLPILIILFITDRACGAPLYIYQELCAYQVISDPLPCTVWECIPLWIFKVAGDIWDINFVFICVAASSATSYTVSSSTFSTSSSSYSAATVGNQPILCYINFPMFGF